MITHTKKDYKKDSQRLTTLRAVSAMPSIALETDSQFVPLR
jgi:hypothetical protein